MEVYEIQNLKNEVEKLISELLEDFTKKTGCTIEKIEKDLFCHYFDDHPYQGSNMYKISIINPIK